VRCDRDIWFTEMGIGTSGELMVVRVEEDSCWYRRDCPPLVVYAMMVICEAVQDSDIDARRITAESIGPDGGVWIRIYLRLVHRRLSGCPPSAVVYGKDEMAWGIGFYLTKDFVADIDLGELCVMKIHDEIDRDPVRFLATVIEEDRCAASRCVNLIQWFNRHNNYSPPRKSVEPPKGIHVDPEKVRVV